LGADRGYTQVAPEHFHLPVRAIGYSLVMDYMDYKDQDLGRQANSGGAVLVDGCLYCPAASGPSDDRREPARQVTVKRALVAFPPGVVTWMSPVLAPVGTLVVISVAVSLMMTAASPLKLTFVAPDRLVPVMVTVVPTFPESGAIFVMVGTGMILTGVTGFDGYEAGP